MLTIDALRDFGADPDEGLGRCVNNEAMYLRLVNMALDDPNIERLSAAVASGDKQAAFEAAHAIKGVMGNLSITPLFTVSSEMTELLRAGKDADYPAMLEQFLKSRDQLIELRDS